jgi:hypothetical protein
MEPAADNDRYARAAAKYRPRKTWALFVAEAPPNSLDRYFYFEETKRADWLWIVLMKGLYGSEWGETKSERLRKRMWLERFRKDGFQLIDALKEPVSGPSKKRTALIRSAGPALVREIKELAPEHVILIKATVYDALSQRLRDAGLPVVNIGGLPFPSSGRQTEFADEFRRLMKIETSRIR